MNNFNPNNMGYNYPPAQNNQPPVYNAPLPYGQPPVYNPYYPPIYVAPPLSPEEQKAKKLSNAALILGIVSLALLPVLFLFPLAAVIPACISIICGLKAMKISKKFKGYLTGICLSVLAVIFAILTTIFMFFFIYKPAAKMDWSKASNADGSINEDYITDYFEDYYSDLLDYDSSNDNIIMSDTEKTS